MKNLNLTRRELLTASVVGVTLATLSPVMGATDFLGLDQKLAFAPQAWTARNVVAEAMLPHEGRNFLITYSDGSTASATLTSVTNHSKQPDVVQFSLGLSINGKSTDGPVRLSHNAFGSLDGIYLTEVHCTPENCKFQATICRLSPSAPKNLRGA